MLKKRLLQAVSLVSLALFLTGCGEKNTATHADQYAPSGKDTFVMANGSEPGSLDPVLAETDIQGNISVNLYEGLTSENQSNQPVPGVAESWQVSQDGKIYTFHLRKDAKWSNGEPVTANDFVYSLERAVTPKTASPVAYKLTPIKNADAIMAGKLPPNALGVQALDSSTLQITLDHPVHYFLSITADPVSYPVYEKGVAKYGEAFFQADKMISDGPYSLRAWVPNGYVLATKNPYYWDAENVHIENVKFLPTVDRTASLNAYAAGEVDLVRYIPTANLDSIKQKYGAQLRTTPWLDLEYLDFNMTKPPFKDNKKLREALSLVINREALVKNVIRDGSLPVYSLFTPTIEGGLYKDIHYSWADWPMDERIALAKKLYAEAGYTKENPLKISIEYNTDQIHKAVMEAVAQMWQQTLGVQVALANSEFKVFLKIREAHNYDGVARDGWIADFDTIDNFATLWVCNVPQNNSGYCNPAYDQLIQQAQQQPTPQAAQPHYAKALEIALNDYPSTPLYVPQVIHLVKPYVKNYQMETNHLDHIYVKWLSFDYDGSTHS